MHNIKPEHIEALGFFALGLIFTLWMIGEDITAFIRELRGK